MITKPSMPRIVTLTLFAIGMVMSFGVGPRTAIAQEITRIWSDDSGTFSTEAKLLKINESSVSLEKANGVEIEVPLARLSRFDVEFLKGLQQKAQPAVMQRHAIDASLVDRDPPVLQQIPETDHQSLLPRAPEKEIVTHFGNPHPPGKEAPAAGSFAASGSFQAAPIKSLDVSKPLLSDVTTNIQPGPRERSLWEVSTQDIERLPEPYRTTARNLSDINQRKTVREGLMSLNSDWPDQEYPALTKLIRGLADSPDATARKQVVDLLAQHDAKASLGILLDGTQDKSFFVRWACYDWLEKLGDPRAIEPLVKQLESDEPTQAVTAVISFGTAAESHVVPLINHESTEIQMTACSVLAEIGSIDSIPTLETAAKNSSSVKVRMQARNAIERIKQREQVVE